MIFCGVNLSKLNFSFHVGSSLVPFGFKRLAMATPGSVKLNKPDILRLSENRVKVAVSQNNNIAVSDGLLTSPTV